jgi:hypothetical protein
MPWVREIDYTTAKIFVEDHHYSHKMPRGKSVCFGWFDGETLYAVANYGVGVNMMAHDYLARNTTLPVTQFNLFELKRLCRVGEKNDSSRHPLTQFLSVCHNFLHRDYGIDFIVSFSDPEHNHQGELYRIANFINLGSTRAEVHYVGPDRSFVHRRVPYRQMQKYNIAKALEKHPEDMANACEAERIVMNTEAGYARYKEITMETEHRNARRILGKDAKTFIQAVNDGHYTRRSTMPKARWFLPLLPEHRNKLENLKKTGELIITRKGELRLNNPKVGGSNPPPRNQPQVISVQSMSVTEM